MELLVNDLNLLKPAKYSNQAGVDVYVPRSVVRAKPRPLDLGLQVQIPAGHVGFLVPRSSTAKEGLNAIPVPIDPGYTGNLHAFIYSTNGTTHTVEGFLLQLILMPIVHVVPTIKLSDRGDNAFGSTGV